MVRGVITLTVNAEEASTIQTLVDLIKNAAETTTGITAHTVQTGTAEPVAADGTRQPKVGDGICSVCGTAIPPNDTMCEDCAEATSCPRCGCRHTGGDLCEGCAEADAEARAEAEAEEAPEPEDTSEPEDAPEPEPVDSRRVPLSLQKRR